MHYLIEKMYFTTINHLISSIYLPYRQV